MEQTKRAYAQPVSPMIRIVVPREGLSYELEKSLHLFCLSAKRSNVSTLVGDRVKIAGEVKLYLRGTINI
jgi:hypothetical protein